MKHLFPEDKILLKLEVSDTWECRCGEEHELGLYVAAHWRDVLTMTCDCGRKFSLIAGLLELIEDLT